MTSHYENIPQIIEWIIQEDPKTVVDIGFGHGKYGFLTKEYLEIRPELLDGQKHSVILTGIEAFRDGITELQRNIYDIIMVQEIEQTNLNIHFDLALWIDVLEHLEHDQAIEVMKRNAMKAKTHLISTPIGFYTEDLKRNEHYDSHKCLITQEDIYECFKGAEIATIKTKRALLARVKWL